MPFIKERIGRLLTELEGKIYPVREPILRYSLHEPSDSVRDPSDLDPASGRPFAAGDLWHRPGETIWLDTHVKVSPDFAGTDLFFAITTGLEGGWDATNPQLTLHVDGHIRQGLDINHREALLMEDAKPGHRLRLTLSAYSGDVKDPIALKTFLIGRDREVENYYYDLKVPYDLACLLSPDDPAYLKIIPALNASLNELDLRRNSPHFRESLRQAQKVLEDKFYSCLDEPDLATLFCIGHSHIDVAWLWTLAVTRQKTVRSFATVLALMEEFPEYRFMASQPQLYAYLQEESPELFAKVKKRIAQGRWEAEGAMFVEADCNLASGEALVRQILAGKSFFKEHFGVDNQILWLPDVFGYSAALPQIMKKSGIRYFMTTKISWNESNPMPYDTFEWMGIDGSRVLTHFIPTQDLSARPNAADSTPQHQTTYNGELSASQVMGTWQRFQQKSISRKVLMAFGHGDGGGGPTRGMLQRQKRFALGMPGAPKTRMAFAREFFQELEEELGDGHDLPVWNGELYLEYHRGTYTSMARNKKYNRRSERAWQNSEWLHALSHTLLQSEYPTDAIRQGWQVVLRNQFHDILPGSSIREVYDESQQEYEQTLQKSQGLNREAMECISQNVAGSAHHRQLIVFNPSGTPVSGPIRFEDPLDLPNACLESDVGCLPCVTDADGQKVAWLPQIPALGYRAFQIREDRPEPEPDGSDLSLCEKTLQNRYWTIQLDERGHIVSFWDRKSNRQLLPPGKAAARLVTFEDKPHAFDAWDINDYYQEKSWPVDDVQSIRVLQQNNVFGQLQIRRRYLQSTIVQTITIWQDDPQIDLHFDIDWKEEQLLLKAFFPVDVQTREATFDIQYGNVTRPIHQNTSWDQARFEVSMHQWLDLSENGYGLSILNDCKYGCQVKDRLIGLTLIKSALHPNPDADKERHQFTFSLLPHAGDWRQAQTVRRAYALNNPLQACLQEKSVSGSLPISFSFVHSNRENVIIESVKQAEDKSGWIVRLYECHQRRTQTRLTFGLPLASAIECDLMEQPLEKSNLQAFPDHPESIALCLSPYDIRSIRVHFAANEEA